MIKITYLRDRPGYIEIVKDGKNIFVEGNKGDELTSEVMTDDLIVHEELSFIKLSGGKSRKKYYTVKELDGFTVKELKVLADKQGILLSSGFLKDEIVSFMASSKIEKK